MLFRGLATTNSIDSVACGKLAVLWLYKLQYDQMVNFECDFWEKSLHDSQANCASFDSL